MQILISSGILYITARINYLLFHCIVETFAIIVAVLIFVLATRTYRHSHNNMFLFLGISYLHVAVLDFAHTLTYKGMGVFPAFGADPPTQLWVAGRFMEAASFLIVLFLLQRKFSYRLVTAIYSIVTAGLILSIMVLDVFPVCFSEDTGLTGFKIACEYVIIFILLLSTYLLHQRKDIVGEGMVKPIATAMLITAAAELSFTLYTDVYGVANLVGHLLKVASYYVIFTGVVAQGIEEPYSMISNQLKERATKDSHTELCNFQGLIEFLENEDNRDLHKNKSLGVFMIDLDNFKSINDTYGHLFGNQVLKEFAGVLENSIRGDDIACRFGGDEFVILVWDVDIDGLSYMQNRIEAATEDWIGGDERLLTLGISIGYALSPAGESVDINVLLKTADKNMYAVKQKKKDAQGW